jgi:hypothetical protein
VPPRLSLSLWGADRGGPLEGSDGVGHALPKSKVGFTFDIQKLGRNEFFFFREELNKLVEFIELDVTVVDNFVQSIL